MNKLTMSAVLGTLSLLAGYASAGAGTDGGAAAAPATSNASAKNASAGACAGTWKIEFQTPMGPQTVTMKLTQNGTQVTGTASDPMSGADNPISGTCEGGAMELGQKLESPMGPIELKFSGKTSGNTVSGNVAFGPMGESPFTGTKQ